jgi:hypothetical protein
MSFRRRNEEHYLPDKLDVSHPNHKTVDLVRSSGASRVAEIGIYEGGTSACLAEVLAVGGIMDFDDYSWSLAKSQTMNPTVLPTTARMHTNEQIKRKQVKMVIELLVRTDPRYEEIVRDKAFRKVAT